MSPTMAAWVDSQTRLEVKVSGIKAMGVDLSNVEPGDPVVLVPEPTNPVDPNAIAVQRSNGEPLGYVAREWAAAIASNDWSAQVLRVHEFEGRKAGLQLALRRRGAS